MEYKFSELFKWTSGKPIAVSDGDIPVYGSNGVIGYTSESKYNNKIILGRVGAYCGSVEYCKGDFNATDNTLVTSCDTTKILYHYAYYLLKLMELNKYAGGSAQPLITQGLLKHLKCDLPEIVVQEAIVNTLSAYDLAIENNNKRIKILEQMAENLYKEWFIRFRFPGHEDVEFENGIPKGWKRLMISDASTVCRRGISPEYDDEGIYTVISQKCIRTNIMDITEARQQRKSYNKELNLQDGDTVICSTGTGTLGRVGKVIGSYPDTTYDSHVTLVRAKKGISKQYLYGALKEIQPWFMNMGIGSTNQQELYITTIRKATVLIPNESIMERYDNIARGIHDEIGIILLKNENLIKQRDLLLPRLMSGKLQVK